MKKIYLGNNKYTIVDEEDFKYLKRFNWKINWKTFNGKKHYYASIKFQREYKSVNIYLHEFLINNQNYECITHKNGDTLDNRKENLEIISYSLRLNRASKRKNIYSKYKGLTYRPKKKVWEARIAKDGKSYYCGQFKSEEDGARAYDKKSRELYGKLSYQNITA